MSDLKVIEKSIVEAMKAKESFRLGVLRMVKTELKNKTIDLRRDLEGSEFIEVLSRMVKQRKEAQEQFKNGGRDDLAEKEGLELAVIQEFLPQPLALEELDQLIRAAIAKLQATDAKQMGLVMKEIKDQTTGRVDGKIVSERVKTLLSGASQ